MHKLFTRYLNSAAYFDTPNDKGAAPDPKAAAQAERDAIAISSSTEENSNEENNNQDQDQDQENNDEEETETEQEEEESDEDNNKSETDPPANETEEQKTARLAAEKEARRAARHQRKFDKLAAEKTAAENKVKELEAKLKEQPVEGLTEEEVERRASAKAEELLTTKERAAQQKQFEKNCDDLEAAAIKINDKFTQNLNELVEELGPVPGKIINILADLDNENGGDVLNYLATNVDEAEDLFELKDKPEKLAMKLVRISDKLKQSKAPAARQRSQVPPPITPIKENDGNKSVNSPITGKEDMELFAAKRAKQVEERRRIRGY